MLQITVGHRPTKFGKYLSKSNFDRTLVRSQKNCHAIHFFAVTKSDCKFTQFAVCNKIYEAFYLTLRRNGYIHICLVTYIYLVTYIVVLVFVPTKFKLCPTKIKSHQTNVLPSQIFICSPTPHNPTFPRG